MKMLPSDRYLASLIGLTDEEYQYFKEYVQKEYDKAPAPAAVAGLETATIIAIAQLVIGTGLLIAGELLRPKPQSQRNPGQPEQKTIDGKQIVRNTDFAPKYGFDSTQGVTALGATIPVVFANRESGYGGVRINLPLLWSQTLSLYGGQMFRGVFLLGEASIGETDTDNYAIGSSLIQNFYFTDSNINDIASRATVYERKNGGRIQNADRVLGRTAANDPGNGSANGVDDVYRVFRNQDYRTDFCASYVPNSETIFGVYAPIGNALVYRVNPSIQPGVRSVYTTTDPERIRVECPSDGQQLNLRDKYSCRFVTRSGITGTGTDGSAAGGTNGGNGSAAAGLRSFAVNSNIRYRIFSSSELMPGTDSDGHPDYNNQTVFDRYTNDSTDNDDFDRTNEGTEARCDDVSQTIAGMQSTWDDSLIEGEKYKIGTATAVCWKRDPNRFISTADRVLDASQNIEENGVTAEFKVTEPGVAGVYSATNLQARDSGADDTTGEGTNLRVVGTGGYNGTSNNPNHFIGGHLMRYAEAFITSSRPVIAIELSIRSAVGIRVSNLCNFNTVKDYKFIDENYCRPFSNTDPGQVFSTRHSNDTVTAAVERYSFFKVQYRIGDTTWGTFNDYVGVKGETQQNQYNYIRIESRESEQTISVKLIPVSGFEIRYEKQVLNSSKKLYILNSNFDADDTSSNAIRLTEAKAFLAFHGEEVRLARSPFMFWLGNTEVSDSGFQLASDYDYDWKNNVGGPVRLRGLPKTDARKLC